MKEALFCLLIGLIISSCGENGPSKINRHDLVNRHRVVNTSADSLGPLSVGNGDFAFTVDITGLQSFPGHYMNGIPLGTLSNWGWHSYPNTGNYTHEQVIRKFDVSGREVEYFHDFSNELSTERGKASRWLRENPHRINLGMIGLQLYDQNGRLLRIGEIEYPNQELNLWKGEITSTFEADGVPVRVVTICHPDQDLVAAGIHSELIKKGQLKVELRFPEADPSWKNAVLWGDDTHHQSRIIKTDTGSTMIEHVQDSTRYFVVISNGSGELTENGKHRFVLVPSREKDSIEFSCEFVENMDETDSGPDFGSARECANSFWETFWNTGGAVDFSACSDPRAFELERRVILSRYLTQIQCSGYLPPQETGLTFNSWYGKFHLEMHWWHGVHFALWQKESVLEKQMEYYPSISDQARNLASKQHYEGIRWPKMTGPDGMTSPSTVGNYLIWQQPHYIYFAELLYQLSGDKVSTLEKYGKLVFETAEFMASLPVLDSINNRYILAPPLIPAQETFDVYTTMNPSFELTYWHWALNRAIEWKKRINEPVPSAWSDVANRLSKLPIKDSLYLFTENGSDSYDNLRYLSDHPVVLGCMGMLPPSELVNPEIMDRTFRRIVSSWNWPATWGWDFPMVAMAAGALGRYEEAMDYLLLDVQKNTYLPNGHNYQDERLTLYLPGNGALLTAVARMCTKDQFPKNGKWKVRWENLNDFF
ncbi:MAG: hypothetical protein V2B15_18630 [Bacteroidota bacterium]